jgi:hypothetical protein
VLAGFGEGIQLLGVAIDEDPLGRALYHVTLHWRAETAIENDLVVRLRLVDADGGVRWTGEGVRPVGGLYPTNAWHSEVPISDYHEVPIQPWLSPGSYSLEVGLFAPFDDRGVMVDDGSTAWLTLQRLDVEPPSDPDPLPHRRLCSFAAGSWLTGFDSPGEVTAGAPFAVDLAWQGVGEGERVRFSWAAPPGRELPAGGRQVDGDTSALTGGMLRSRHVIAAPRQVGRYTLRVGLVGQVGRCGWLALPSASCSLTEVRVRSGEEGLANFEERVLLVDADAPQSGARPGDIIRVTLRWRGLRTMEEDYTVFVHLVGPDGRLHGQADSWPVQGTYPTSQWPPGREVTDPYEVRLEPDAPPGPYRVEVGWYHLKTMQRLQIVDEEGQPTAESFVVGAFDVAQ